MYHIIPQSLPLSNLEFRDMQSHIRFSHPNLSKSYKREPTRILNLKSNSSSFTTDRKYIHPRRY